MSTKNPISVQPSLWWRFLLLLLLSLSSGAMYGQSLNTWVQDVVLPPPNAASLGKFGDIPVDLVSGIPNVSIPIATINDGSLSLPVSLSYHPSGVRVSEMASWVGLGWNLNAGGMVSRTVLGIPDEANGYWYNGEDVETYFEDRQFLKDISTGIEDGEADMFSFSFSGLSGKFFFDKNNDYHVIPQNLDIQIEVDFDVSQSEFDGFTILGPDGTRYIFGKDGSETAYEYLQAGLAAGNWRSAWMLLKIESSDRQYAITFDYVDEIYQYKNLASCQYNEGSTTGPSGAMCGGIGEDLYRHPYNLHLASGKRLTSIQASKSGYSIDFGANTLREDLATNRLDFIQISSAGGIACTRFDFSYTYFEDGQTIYSGTPLPYFKRLKLTQVQEFSCNNSLERGFYSLVYDAPLNPNGTQYLPHRLSKATDHWGYYNGKHNNESLETNIPPTTLTHPVLLTPITYGSADRLSDPSFMTYGSLKELKYPTGGKTIFEMEANAIVKGEYTNPIYLIQNLYTCLVPSQSCCGTVPVSTPVSFLNTSEIDDAFFDLEAARLTISPPCASTFTSGKIEIRDQNNTLIGSSELILSLSENVKQETQKPLKDILNAGVQLYPNIQYTFVLTSENGQANFALYHQSLQQIAHPVGGLRIATIQSDDNIAGTPDVVKTYLYNDKLKSDLNTGDLLYEPNYGITGSFNCLPTLHYYGIFSDIPYVPMSNYEGRHIAYSEVSEVLAGSGKTVYQYQLNIAPSIFAVLGPGGGYYDGNTVFTSHPQLFKKDHGNLLKKKVVSESGAEVSIETTTPLPQAYSEPPGSMLRIKWLYDEGLACQFYGFIFYRPRTGAYLVASQEVSTDGVSTLTSYTYDPELDQHQPISVRTNNSDGTITEQRLKFVDAYDPNTFMDEYMGLTAQDLLDLNLISSPVESQTWQGQTGSLEMIGGQLNQFVNLGNSQQVKVRTHKMYGFETTIPVDQSSLAEQSNPSGQYTSLFPSSSYYQERIEFDYDYSSGRILSQALTGAPANSYIWGHSHLRPIAEVNNASASNIAYTSFEETDNLQEGNWTLGGQAGGYQLFNAKTGWQGFNLSPTRTLTASGLEAGTYTLSFWLNGNDDMVFFANGTIISNPVVRHQSDPDPNGWVYIEYDIPLSGTNNSLLIGSNDAALLIDELRLYPSHAQMTTYCYDQALRIRTITDVNNQSIFYIYDALGRLSEVRDFEGNVINQTEYHYYTE